MDHTLYLRIANMTEELKLGVYPNMLLNHMIYERVTHPNERTDEILVKVTKKMVPEAYKRLSGKMRMKTSINRELHTLEAVLHDCENLPDEDLARGFIISNTVKYYAKKIMED